jgi:hypothetical protein
VYCPATNRSIGVGGHLQDAFPNLRNFGFQFAWAERPECPAALPRVGTVSEFKPVRGIALASSHDQQRGSFVTEVEQRSPGGSLPKTTHQNTVFGPRVADAGLNKGHLGVIRAPEAARFAQGALLRNWPLWCASPLPESCQCGSIAAIS